MIDNILTKSAETPFTFILIDPTWLWCDQTKSSRFYIPEIRLFFACDGSVIIHLIRCKRCLDGGGLFFAAAAAAAAAAAIGIAGAFTAIAFHQNNSEGSS